MPVTRRIQLRFEGDLDVPAAHRIAQALERARDGALLLVDLTHAREVHDAALAVLAAALRPGGAAARVVVRGLRAHHQRILRYLGVDPRRLEGLPSAG